MRHLTRLIILFVIVIGCAWKVHDARTEVFAKLARDKEMRELRTTRSSGDATQAIRVFQHQGDTTGVQKNDRAGL